MSEYRCNLLKMGGSVMPQWFREHIICWYDPVRQGATNESLKAEPRLIDLSGKGFDATLHNFGYTAQSGIDANGDLQFDGVNDYAVCNKDFVLADFTVMTQRSCENTSGSYPCVAAKYISGRQTLAFESIAPDNNTRQSAWSFGRDNTININKSFSVSYMTPTSYNGQRIYRGSLTDSTTTKLCLGKAYPSQYNAAMKICLRAFLLFDGILTDAQIQWVRERVLNS